MIIATAGHVDHGKTLLVHQLTGIETDSLEEEKARGLTIDLGFAYIEDEFNNRLGFVDVPGHTRFISNMLAGVSAVDFALLVVAADDGPMPQTLEHLAILDLLGIGQGIAVITKIDRVEPDRVIAVKEEVRQILQGTSLEAIELLPVSSITGKGIDDLKLALASAALEWHQRTSAGFFRLAVDRCFSIKGAGLVVTGSVFSGEVKTGDELTLMPQREPVRVRGLHRQNLVADRAAAGDRCAVNITGRQLTRDQLSRGDWLTSNRDHQSTQRVDVHIKVLASQPRALRHWTRVHVHAAASHTLANVATLDAPAMAPGESGLVQLILDEPLHLCSGDRIVLRDAAATSTIGGGPVIDPYSPARGRAKPERIATLHALIDAAPDTLPAVYLAGHELGVSLRTLGNALNLPMPALLAAFPDQTVTHFPAASICNPALAVLARKLLAGLELWHQQNPQKSGISDGEAVRLLPRGCTFSRELLAMLVSQKSLVQSGSLYSLPGYAVSLSAEAEQVWRKVAPILAAAGTKPPVLHDLATTLQLQPKTLDKLLKECVKAKLLIRPVENRYFVPDALEQLRVLLSVAAKGAPFTVQQYRDVSGIGRNLSIEILEYFDRQKVTRRNGDLREIL